MLKRRILGFFCGLLIVGVVSTVTGAARAADACDATELSKIFALTGYVVDNTCVPTLCENGYELADKSCNKVGEACAREVLDEAHAMVGYLDNGGVCVPTACLNGYVLEEKQCVKRGNGCSAAALEAINASAGYWLDNACTATVCLNGFVLDNGVCTVYSSNQGGGSGTPVVADCGKNLFNPQLLKEGGLTYNSTNYTFSGRLTRDYQNATKKNTGDFTANHYMSNYSYGLLPKTTYKLVYTIKCDTDSNSVKAQDMIIGLKTKSGNTVNNVAPTVGACTNDKVTVTVSAGNSTTDVVGVYVGRASGVTEDYDGELNISNVMLVLNTESTSSMIQYGPCIKVSTKASTSRREAGVESRLGNLRDMINHLITRTQSSAVDINTLDSGKQTRPADEATDDCQAGDTCLLIKDVSGANHWYRIETCNENDFLADVGNIIKSYNGSTWNGVTHGTNIAGTDSGMCSYSGVNCANNEWVRSYTSGAVFGKAKRVAIAQRSTGTIVSLSGNLESSGNVCVCQVTGYAVGSNPDAGYQTKQTFDAGNRWVVAGQMSFSDMTDADCVSMCANAGTDSVWDQANQQSAVANYCDALSSSCNGTVSVATMCNYNRWFDSILVDEPMDGNAGWTHAYGGANVPQQLCDGATGVDATWCNTESDVAGHNNWAINTFVAKLPTVTATSAEIAQGDANYPVLYGRAYCTDMNVATPALSVLDESEIGTKYPEGIKTDSNGQNTDALACVCQLQGYKNNAASTMTTINNSKYIYTGWSEVKCYQLCQAQCADLFITTSATNGIIRELADSCAAN